MSRDAVREEVPRFKNRVGDNVVAGANNSVLVLGRDRTGSIDSGFGASALAGAAHLIVGRRGEDPSFTDDSASVVLSMKSDVDEASGMTSIGVRSPVSSAAMVRADCVRLSARRDIKISCGRAYLTISSDGSVVIEGDVSLGKGAAQRIIRGDAFASEWANHVHPTPVGPSGKPLPLTEGVFSPTNKVS